jgi:hypothetical protein
MCEHTHAILSICGHNLGHGDLLQISTDETSYPHQEFDSKPDEFFNPFVYILPDRTPLVYMPTGFLIGLIIPIHGRHGGAISTAAALVGNHRGPCVTA